MLHTISCQTNILESCFFLLCGRDPIIPLHSLFNPKVRYLDTLENILSLEALKSMYQVVVTNWELSQKKVVTMSHIPDKKSKKVIQYYLKTIKPFYGIQSMKVTIVLYPSHEIPKVEVVESTGKSKVLHILDIKYIVPAFRVIAKLPNINHLVGNHSKG